MFSTTSILEALREFGLSCIGSPQSRGRQLHALRRLDAHLLKDIGLTPEQVRAAKVLEDLPRPAPRMGVGQPSLNR